MTNTHSIQKKSHLIKQLFALTKNYLVISALSYCMTIQIANKLGPYQFGIYSYILLMGSVFSIIVLFSTEQTAPILYSKTKKKIRINNITYSLRLFFLGISILCTPLLFFKSTTIAFGSLVVSLGSLNLSFLYEIKQKNIEYSYIFLIERFIYLGITYILLLCKELSIKHIFIVLFLSTCTSLSWQIYTNKKIFKHFKFLNFKELMYAIKNNIFLVLISFSTFAYGGLSRLIIESKLGMKELGIYSAGWQIIMLVSIFQAQVVRTWRINISKAILDNDRPLLRKHLKNYFLLSTIPVTLLAIATIFVSKFIVMLLFGPEYSPLIKLLPIFSLYFVVINLDSLANMLWVSLSKQFEYLGITLASTSILCLCLYALPNHIPLHYLGLTVIGIHGLSITIQLSYIYLKFFKRSQKTQQFFTNNTYRIL